MTADQTSDDREQKLCTLLNSKLKQQITSCQIERGDLVVTLERTQLLSFFKISKEDSDLQLTSLVSVTAVDWLDQKESRFEVVYHLLSYKFGHRVRVKVVVPEDDPCVDSLTELWASAVFMEREVWDMFGIKFKGHPDLRRILMYEEFEGHALRKDYPFFHQFIVQEVRF